MRTVATWGTRKWQTKEGEKLLVYEIETRHLNNTITFLHKNDAGGGPNGWIVFAAEELRYRTENPEYAALCHAIFLDRDDYLPRLALADWLQEHGLDGQAGEVRAEVERRRTEVVTQYGGG